MDIKFTFNGVKKEETRNTNQHLQSVQPGLIVYEYIPVNSRAAGLVPVEIEAKEDDVIELQLSNDVIWHYRADEYKTILEFQAASRGTITGDLKVPDSFVVESGSSRGVLDFLVPKSLKLITGWAAKETALLLAKKMEEKLLLGLHYCNNKLQFLPFDKTSVLATRPYLLFIHGTNSSNFGAFKDLLFNDAYKKLYDKYEGRVIAFEHKTLSESPLKNIVDLLNQLPAQISVDVISHSRGGIVADLLARCSDGDRPFNDEELRIIKGNDDLQGLYDEVVLVNNAAAGKNILVNKMVRVACPSAGTVLIGKRLDNYVNVFCNLVNLVPGANQVVPLTMFLDFAKAVVQERTDLKTLPGLEALMPESPLTRIMNNNVRSISSELYVISGDVERSGFWNTLKVFGTNVYFGEAHDLVVNSNSMFKGTYRSSVVKEHFEQESNVNHFNYFKNKNSQNALLAVLLQPESTGEYFTEIGATENITVIHNRGITGKKPLVFILPGIMGSNLTVDDKKIWADYISICSGKLSELVISNAVNPRSIHDQTYAGLVNYLNNDFDVMPFPYDWRASVKDTASLLATSINDALADEKRTCREIHFVAHSMGGLVLRALIHYYKDTWKNVLATQKPRVLMLGVPNEGSYSTIRFLLGKDSIIKKLALLDFIHPKKTLLNIFKEYPGLIQLLPAQYSDIYKEASWNAMLSANGEEIGIPSQQLLDEGLQFYEDINGTDYDNEIFRYIAGQDTDTPEGLTIRDNRIIFTASSQGDGRVLWNTIPSTLLAENIYYVPAEHGNITKYEPAYEGIKELLLKGKTSFLTNTRPAARNAGQVKTMPESDYVTVPAEHELQDAIMSNKQLSRKLVPQQTITLSVTNGDLIHSKYPVVVGHFQGDGIVKAEKYVDRAVDFKLSEYHAAGNYPGEIGSHLVILNDNIGISKDVLCKGAVVAGLGEFGSLTESRLTLTLTQAFLTLAIKHNEYVKNSDLPPAAKQDFGVTSLLIGSDFAGLRIYTCVKAILTAVIQANEKLTAMNTVIYQKINRVEIIEIFQHKAIQIGRTLNGLIEQDRFNQFKFLPPAMKFVSGALKLIPDESQQDNWHRLEISIVKDDEEDNSSTIKPRAMRFTAITDKAHADQDVLPTNRLIVDSLIAKVARLSKWDKIFSQTLYELLIPNEFKGYGSSLNNIVLIVDAETARYPWELLHDSNGISDKPLVINTGIIRQLSTKYYRKHVELNVSDRALVIGNPLTDGRYPDLPAAKKEAQRVLSILQFNGLAVTDCIEKTDIEVVQNLLVPSYKIIHIASHGIVGETADDPTGVIIGSEMIFTAADFKQIRIVPEFVFLNCCSSNVYDTEIDDKMHRKYDLAASIGTQLIEMGVRAAIVTGWEINDQAAEKFSQEFYTQMFTGKGFGESVQCARQETYENFGQTNTWGAYQCYGDPFYTFRESSRSVKKTKLSFIDPIEVTYEIENLINEVTSASRRVEGSDYKVRIDNIIDALQLNWKTHPEIVEGFATLYNTLNQYDSAIEYYEKLLTLDNAGYSVRSLEQYSSVRVRRAERAFRDKKLSKRKAVESIQEAIRDIERIRGNTSERYSLLAACYRRLFNVNKDYKTLEKTAEYYQLAYEFGEKNRQVLPYYPYFNWLHFALLLSDPARTETYLAIPATKKNYDERALADADQRDQEESDFFHKTARSSFYMAELLSATKSTEIKTNVDLIEKNFRQSWRITGKPSEWDSFTHYVQFIISLLGELPPNYNIGLREEKAKALTGLIERISG